MRIRVEPGSNVPRHREQHSSNAGKYQQKSAFHHFLDLFTMAKCSYCNKESSLIAENLGVCLDCIRKHFRQVLPLIEKAHHRTRKDFDLPDKPPRDPEGIACQMCINECIIPTGKRGYCGLRRNDRGKLRGVNKNRGNLDWYQNMATRTWLFFSVAVPLIVFSVRTGTGEIN